MKLNSSDEIMFDVLVRAQATGEKPDVTGLGRFRPDPEDVEICRRWFAREGVTCHTTDFGLACSASPERFESLFSTQVKPAEQKPDKPPWVLCKHPEPPKEIARYIAEITLSVMPQLF